MNDIYIYGIGKQAQLCRYYIEKFQKRNVNGFIIDLKLYDNTFDGLPLLKIEDFLTEHNPSNTEIFVAIGAIALNSIRKYYFDFFASKGFTFINCIDPKIEIPLNSTVGLNTYIVESSSIHPFVKIGSNFSSTNSIIAHHCVIEDNVTIIGSKLAGNVKVQESVFIGGNCFVEQGITIGKCSIINSGSIISSNIAPYTVVTSQKSQIRKIDARRVKLLGESYKCFTKKIDDGIVC